MAIIMLVWGVLAAMAQAGQPDTLAIRIDGHRYQAQISGNTQLAEAMGAHAALVQGKHFRGRLESVNDSWLRLSRIENRWTGVVSLFGRLHRVSGSVDDNELRAQPVVQALNELDETPQCVTPAEPAPLVSGSGDSGPSTLAMPTAETTALSEPCSTRVDGVCLLPELELVFDSQFTSTFSANPEDQAISLLNIVDGFYRQDLDVAFETLTIEFPNTELFNDSSDAREFLGDPGDSTTTEGITDKKPELEFIANQNALLHVVTGRDFNDATVGVAWQDVLCRDDGFSSGTSQVLNHDIALTAVVVAHELGHNFGAVHDGDSNSCPNSGFIMSAAVNTVDPPDGFSSCSITEIEEEIEELATGQTRYSLEQCFQHPVDASIVPDPDNPDEVNESTTATLDLFYNIGYEQTHSSLDMIRVTGSLESADGQLVEAALAGSSCSIGSNELTYNCTNLSTARQLRVRVRSANDQLRLGHTVHATDSDVKDMVAGNDYVSTNLPVTLPSEQPTDLAASGNADSIELNWTDQARGEHGYQIQRKSDGTSSWTLVSTEPADTQSWTDHSVERYQPYDYRVAATGPVEGSAANVASAVAGIRPSAPSGLILTVEADQLKLEWQDNTSTEDAYLIERQQPGDTDWTLLATLAADREQYLDSTVARGQRYRYRVTAKNAVGLSPASAVVEGGLSVSGSGGDGGGRSGGSGGGAFVLLAWLALLGGRGRRL